MIQTQSQNVEIIQIADKVWDKVWDKVDGEVGSEAWKVWIKVRRKLFP